MRILALSKILVIILIPVILFLISLNFAGFDNSFYKEKFSEYKINENMPRAVFLHEKVMDFIQGKSNELPNEFNEREKGHLLDVRNIVRTLTIALYIFIAIFIILLVASAFILKINNYIVNFVGKVLFFGGVLTIALAAILFFLIISDFSAAFESFHKSFFEKDTYLFDPANEMIVNLYPEQLFMALGMQASKTVIIASLVIILLGAFMILKSKSKKNKNRGK